MKRLPVTLLVVVFVVLLRPSAVFGDELPNAVLIMGAGYTSNWNTELRIVNPASAPLEIQVGGFQVPIFCYAGPCPPPDPGNLEIPGNGQITVHFTDLWSGTAFQYLYVLPTNPSDPLPVVRARVVSVGQPSRTMELPVVSYAALAAHQNSPLDFPGAEQSSAGHSNLVIAEVTRLAPATVRLDAITDDGTTVATRSISLEAGQNLFLADVIGSMGVQEFSGHLRVTYTGGGGIVDGALATQTSDGGYAVSAGFNP